MLASTGKKHSLIFVSGNAGKAREVGEILGDCFDVQNRKYDISEIQGDIPTGDTPYEKAINHAIQIASAKSRLCADYFGEPVLTEDASLFLTELMNPGVFVKYWSNDQIFKASIGCTDKSLFALSVFTYCKPSESPTSFIGKCDGKICDPVIGAGPNGFAWDTIFVPNDGDGKSFAQMDQNEKNKISHRRKALDMLKINLPKLL